MVGPDRDELLARVDLESLLDALAGPAEHHRWRCPERDHPDEHPSVTVTVAGDGVSRWRCWSGGHGGTAIDAVMAAQGVAVGAAMRWLAERDGSWPHVERPAPPLPPPIGAPKQEVVEFVDRAERLLWTPAGERQREWLAGRGLGEEVLRLNRVGADPGRRFLPRPPGFPGATVKLADIYGVLTVLPGSSRDYSRQELARDLYLLDQSGVTTTKDGRALRLPASALTRGSGVLRTVTRSGQEKVYAGISFEDGQQ